MSAKSKLRKRMCTASQKRRYPDAQSAKAALWEFRQMKKEDSQAHVPTRCYQCEFCHGWHLTSMNEYGQHWVVRPSYPTHFVPGAPGAGTQIGAQALFDK